MSTQLKFDGPRLDELLERVGRELGPDAVILEANRTRRGGVGGFFAKEWFEVVVADPAETEDPAPVDASPHDDPLLALADAVHDHVEPAPEFERVLAEVAAIAPASAPAPAPARSSVVAAAPRQQEAAATAPRLAPPSVPEATALRDLPLADMLRRLDRVVAAPSLPSSAGAVIAVVGDLAIGRHVASSIASRLGFGEADVLVATPAPREGVPAWLRIDGAGSAAARAARWRRGEQPVVVAVDLVPGREGHAWAAEVLAALDADQVRLVARAWQVIDELTPKAAALGGVDGVELVELDAAAEPETFLDLEMPVLGIDGRAATPELWAALLMERRNDARI